MDLREGPDANFYEITILADMLLAIAISLVSIYGFFSIGRATEPCRKHLSLSEFRWPCSPPLDLSSDSRGIGPIARGSRP
jgi:hypothetical protein